MKRNLKKLIALIFILSLTSCEELSEPSSVKISLINNSNKPAQLTFSNGKDVVVIDADGNKTVSKALIFSESLNQDGSYDLRFLSATKDTSYSLGYYTNGSPLDKEFQITWTNDSLKMKSIPRDY